MRLASAHKEVMSGRGKESLDGQAQQLESHMTMFRELLLELKKGTIRYTVCILLGCVECSTCSCGYMHVTVLSVYIVTV